MIKTLVQTDEQGIVQNKVLDVEPYNYSVGAFTYPNDPVVIDNDLANLYYSKTRVEDGVLITDNVPIHPYTEQILSGTVYGGFKLNEQIVQSPVSVEVTNYLVIDGATAIQFSPVVDSVGVTGSFLGQRAARFFGTYNDLAGGTGAGLKLPAISTANYKYFMVEGFLYLNSLPIQYDPILITRGIDIVGGSTQDSFSVEYIAANQQLILKMNIDGMTGQGFDVELNISQQNGVTTGKWHHFAFSVDSGTTTENTQVATFFDGVRNDYAELLVYGVSFGNIRESVSPIMIGCGLSGERPLKGWLDSIVISAGLTSDALRGYIPTLSGISVPTEEPSAGNYTIYHLSMNGPVGTSLFPCDSATRIVSSASYIANEEKKLGVALVSRQKGQFNGITLFNGVCYGHAVTGVCAAPCFGVDSGSCMVVTGVEQLHGLTVARDIRSNAAEFTMSYLIGSTAMQGLSGASGDFPLFFSRNWGGNTFTYLATQTNTTQMQFTYDSVTVSGRTGIFYVKDFSSNIVYGVQTADVKNLYADIVEYHSLSSKIGVSAASRILGTTNMEQLYDEKGFEEEAIAQKVAPNIGKVGILYINNNARVSKKTTIPESAWRQYNLEGINK